MRQVRYIFKPKKLDIYLLDKKKVVTAHYIYGNIVCFDFKTRDYVTDWVSGFFESKRLKKIATMIVATWDMEERRWIKIGNVKRIPTKG